MALAQELPRPSLTHSGETHALPTDYNMKLGPVYFNVNSSLEADYIDNIGLTHNNTLNDFTLTPMVGVTASWPMTKSNTLTFATSVGYTKYLIHPQYDTGDINVAPNSRLAFNIYTGNFKITIHDDFSYEQDPINEGALSNVVNFQRFQNDAGVNVLWDLNKVILNVGYDHINFITTGIQTVGGTQLQDANALNYSADQVSASAEVHISSTLVGGLEGTASTRTYNSYPGDYNQLSVGPYARIQITPHVKAEVSAGYQHMDAPPMYLAPFTVFPATVLQPASSSGSHDSYYFDVTLDHEVNKYYLHRLSVGHQLALGILADQTDTTYVNYTGSWHINSKLNLALNVGWQDVSELGGLYNVASYNMVSAGLQLSFPVTRSISGALIYQFTDKLSDVSDQEYEQNRVGLIGTYHF